jgi:hypothetical protein
MKRFWQILTLLLLALMVPASVCCYGETGCAKSEIHCCSSCGDQGHDDEPCAPASCPSETLSHSQVPPLVAMPELQMVELAGFIQAMMRLQDELATDLDSSGLPMTTAPPELRATWHFTSRAALPVRAPSVLV